MHGEEWNGLKDASVIVIILTFNCADSLAKTISAAQAVSSNIVCVDSDSTDGTREVATAMGCKVLRRAFRNYADQRNWAIAQAGAGYEWQLHLDADEVLDGTAVQSILQAARSNAADGFLLRRRTYFMGRPLRFGGTVTWHLRLFRTGRGRCEDRLYDQHFICDGKIRKLRSGWLHDMNVGSLTEWVTRHNRWSDLEAQELTRATADKSDRLKGALTADPRQRTRLYKGLYYRAPLYWRAVAYFLYRYLLRAGFLDGRVGLVYSVMQALWFRILVDAKVAQASSDCAEASV